ncbi:hypothetical protein [Flavobacterium sp.]|uniref:hypothetical protein n=1 Tax=Flavobacterium sp. TaxID=239 RepID=UPI00286CD5A3|nr:hypothetical protein [Flavobacterium sp.]
MIIGGLILIAACYLWVKFVIVMCNKLHNYLNRNKIKEDSNPYIIEQKARMWNDKNYDDYEKWMRTKGDGFPIEKVLTRDEFEANRKFKRNYH